MVVVTCPEFWHGRAAGFPGPHPIHIISEVDKQTHSYTYHIENCTYSFTFGTFYLFIYYFSHFTYSYTVLSKKDTQLIYV